MKRSANCAISTAVAPRHGRVSREFLDTICEGEDAATEALLDIGSPTAVRIVLAVSEAARAGMESKRFACILLKWSRYVERHSEGAADHGVLLAVHADLAFS